ncbi:MAG: PilX N-terminal domain-containing pilus assembly protein [Nitrospirota bacterium]
MGTIGSKPRRHGVMNNERGFALFGVFLTILMMTALGIAAMTMTGLENRMAGSANSTDAAAAAAESCIGTGVNVIMQTLQERQVPLSYVGPAAVVPANAEGAIAPTLTQEIMGQANNNADVSVGAGAAPDIQMTAGPFAVVGDIDRLYFKNKVGGSLQFASGYEGAAQGAAGGGGEAIYQIDCTATLTATGAMSRIQAVFACVSAGGESCQRKI